MQMFSSVLSSSKIGSMASRIYWSYNAKHNLEIKGENIDQVLDETLYNGKIWIESLTALNNSNPVQYVIGFLTTATSGNSFEHRFIFWESKSFYYSFEFTNDSCVHLRVSKKREDIFSGRNDCTEKDFNSTVSSRTLQKAIDDCKNWLGNVYNAYSHNCQDFVNYIRDR